MRLCRTFITCCFLWIILPVSGQVLLPLERSACQNIEREADQDLSGHHLSVRPLLVDLSRKQINTDSLYTPGIKPAKPHPSWLVRKLFYEHFLKVDSADFSIAADPLLDLQCGADFSGRDLIYRNSRGIQISGTIKNKLAFYTSYLETQARFPSYINDFIRTYEVVPGMNRVKDFKDNSYDYGVASANVSYSPWRFLNLQLGYGKNFFGDGYRSLLLSDNAFQYPFLKVTTTLGRFEYVNLVTSFQNLDTDSLLDAPYIWYNGYQKKGGTFNYLSTKITRWMEFGLFEGIIWESRSLKSHGFNLNQYIPVIFVNTLHYGLFEKNNVLIGCNLNLRPVRKISLYGQFVLDDLHLNQAESGHGYQKTKWGIQAGLKWFDVAGISHLNLQAEYNQVRPYTYGHQDALQSYTHYNQALAHPLGANFREFLLLADYRWKRWYANLSGMMACSGTDTATSHWGSNIFASDIYASNGYNSVDNSLLQGIPMKRVLASLKAGYLFNPKYQLCIEGEAGYRRVLVSGAARQTLYVTLGIRTKLFNQYLDF